MKAPRAAGLVGADAIRAARLGTGILARTAGEDSSETTVDFDHYGQLSLNGQQIR